MEAPKQSPLDTPSALKLVSGFFKEEWAKTDPSEVHLKQITGGFMNTLHLIRRNNESTIEPSSILIRHFGQSGKIEEPPSSNLTLSAAQQAIVCWEMGRRGWGPKVYGFFDGGRLEEFIDSHTLTAAEAAQPNIRRDIARSYARLHSLRLPLRRDNYQLIVEELSEAILTKSDDIVASLHAVNSPIARSYAAIFQATNWLQEFEWVSSLFIKHNCKTTLTQGDTNHLNVLVRNPLGSEGEGEIDSRIVLIDYETTAHSYRGFDLGGHFTERMYCHSQPGSRLTGAPAPDKDEQRVFCEAYLQELRDLGGDLDADVDNVEHLVLEAAVGRLWQVLFTNAICVVFEGFEGDEWLLDQLVHTMEVYGVLKGEFLGKYR